MNRRFKPTIGALGLLVGLLGACASDTTPQTDTSSADGASIDLTVGADASAIDTDRADASDRMVPLYRFEAHVNPETGDFRIERIAADAPATGLRSVEQAMWCDLDVVQDGVPGSGPEDSLELNTPEGTVASSAPGEPVPAECQVPGADEGLYSVLGVFCAEVQVQSFFTTALDDVYVSVDSFGGEAADQGAYAYPRGTAAQSPDGIDAPEDELGLWYYGDLSAAGGGSDTASKVWTFRNVSDGPYTFSGAVYARYDEVCDNGVDDDCDGIVDNRCSTTPDDGECNYDEDCVSGLCADIDAATGEGTCAATCAEGRFGDPCEDCPGGAGALQCTANGTCDDGAAGDGTCDCDTGFTGAACDTCTTGRVGSDCEECPGGAGDACSGNGTCADVAGTPTCSCDAVHSGADCSTCDCENGGSCVGATCACTGDWGGTLCTTCERTCLNGGTANAACDDCDCTGNWTGATCGTCSLTCGGAGVGAANATCTACVCAAGRHGTSCENSCSDGTRNGTEEGVDCGGPCSPCVLTGTSCRAILADNPTAASGTYEIDPDGPGGAPAFDAYCDMTTAGGGWTNLDFARNRVLLENGNFVTCSNGLTTTSNSIRCDGIYFNDDPNLLLYHYYCDGSDSSADYIRTEIGAIVGHRNRSTVGFTRLEQRYTGPTSPRDNEYCYADGRVARYSDPLCVPWSRGNNGNCIPSFFTLSF